MFTAKTNKLTDDVAFVEMGRTRHIQPKKRSTLAEKSKSVMKLSNFSNIIISFFINFSRIEVMPYKLLQINSVLFFFGVKF